MADGDAPRPDEPRVTADRRSGARSGSGSLHRRLTVNSISNASRYLVFLGGSFLLTPFVVRTLGDAAYGFWVVLLAFAGYAGVLELGVQPAIVKLVGQHRGAADWRRLEELSTSALVFFAAIGSVAALLVAFAIPPLVPILVKDHQGFANLHTLFALIGADVLIMFLNYVFAGVLYGWQLYHGKNLIDMAAWVLNALILVAFLRQGGLPLLAASKVGTDLAALVATFLLCRRALPNLHWFRSGPARRAFRELMGFGSKVFLSATAKRIQNYAQPVIISARLSTTATAFFAIPSRLIDYSQQIVWALSTGFMPMFSELDGQQDVATIRSIYVRYSRYLLTCTLPMLALILVYGREFIGLWIGPEYAAAGRSTLYILTGATLAEALQPLFWRLFTGVGRLNLPVAISAAASLLSVALGLLLVRSMGIAGVALGVLVTIGTIQIFFFFHTSRYLGMSSLEHFRQIQARPILIGIVFLAFAYACARVIGSHTYAAMAAGSVLSAIVYAPLAYASLYPNERRTLREALQNMRRPRGTTTS
jgi:O-antigen/teichoic acid export membrane protein